LTALRDSVPAPRPPVATPALLAANVVAYALSIRAGGSIVLGPAHGTLVAYGAIPYEFTHLGSHCALAAAGFSQTVLCSGQAGVSGPVAAQPATWRTAFTALLLNANPLALLLDVGCLAGFGAPLEGAIGPMRFVAFYVLGGLAALGLAIAAHPGSSTPVLGASGAVAAVLAGHLLLDPHAAVGALPSLFALPRPPVWVLAALWLAAEAALGALALSAPAGGGSGSVCLLAGGVAFGLLAGLAFARGRIAPREAANSRYGPSRTA